MQLEDRVALVTGASSGIGRATALRFAAAGARVLVHGRDPGRTAEVAELTGGVPLLADLTDPQAVRALAERARAVHGRVDVLVNNAGTGWSGPLTAMDDATADALLALGLTAPVALTRALLPDLLASGTGALCFVTSIAGRLGVAGEAVYGGAKAGIEGFADSLRFELEGSGLTVSVVVPGAVRTPFFDKRGRSYGRSVPRPVEPEVVADAVVGAVADGRPEVYVPRWLRAAVVIKGVAPRTFHRLATRFGEPVRSHAEP